MKMVLDVEIGALENNCLADPSMRFVSQKQVGGICGLLKQGLEDTSRDNQIATLDFLVGAAMFKIAGVRVTSRKNLTSPVASTLIGLLKTPSDDTWELNAYGKELLSRVEERIKAAAHS